jgi:uncharacterized pyridoxamine 5'-phosphate oxidase family protein
MKKFMLVFLIISVGINLYLLKDKWPSKAAVEKEIANSNVDEVVKFLKDSKVFYIATIDGDKPQLRPFGAVLNIDGKLSLCTGSFKNVYKQIEINPQVAISTMNGDKYIRISGTLFNNTTEENRQKFFTQDPSLEQLYKDNPQEFQVLSFESATAIIRDMGTYEEIINI